MADLYLASKSPRRYELLQQFGLQPEIIHIDVDETVRDGEKPHEYVLRVSKEKATFGWHCAQRKQDIPVLAADTAVIAQGRILGKPTDFDHACEMWRLLRDTEHQVISAVVVQQQERQLGVVQQSDVRMRAMSVNEMRAYWETGEPYDKAGGYAVQGFAAMFIERISGSYSGIMGLPLFETAQILKEFGLHLLASKEEPPTSQA